jgi:hypothetical protein
LKSQDSRFDWAWVLVCAAASTLWCVTAATQLGATFDEPLYVALGLKFWRTGSHAGLMKLGTMPLPIDLATLPLYLWERWRGIPLDPVADLSHFLLWARAASLIFLWLLLAYGWKLGRLIAGPWGGRLAVALLAFEPSILAHASLATTDIAITACLLALVYHFRAGREAGWIRRVALPAFWFGASVLAKASGLVLAPVCLLVVELDRLARLGAFKANPREIRAWTWSAFDRLRPFRRDLLQIVFLGMLTAFVYCGSDWRQEPTFVAWAQSLPDGPGNRIMGWLAEHLRIFSNAGEGLVQQIKHNVRGNPVYLLGQIHPRAFWYYFAVVLIIKLSLPLLVLSALLLTVWPRTLANLASLGAAAMLVLTPLFRVQLGVRLILPLVALATVGVAAGAAHAYHHCIGQHKQLLFVIGVGLGIIWTASSAVAVWPHGLCYVNELWGGTSRGYLLVSDSNYDWGQGLKELACWQQRQKLASMDVWYFGTDPSLKRLPMREVPLHICPIVKPQDVVAHVRGHFLAVSTTLLYGATITEAHRQAAAFLRARQPLARTTTFFIYDFTQESDLVQVGEQTHESRFFRLAPMPTVSRGT